MLLLNLFPIVVSTLGLIFLISHLPGRPILQFYCAIAFAYLNLFPALTLFFSQEPGQENFVKIQIIILTFFEIPFAYFLMSGSGKFTPVEHRELYKPNVLIVPIVFVMMCVFWYVCFKYDLFFRRIGHEGLLRNTESVPTALLYVYRLAVETSFFVVLYNLLIIKYTKKNSLFGMALLATTAFHAGSFLLYFVINSRMQFILLIVCVLVASPYRDKLLKQGRRVFYVIALLLTVTVGLTIFRELYLENNGRVATSSISSILFDSMQLISDRLDSIFILGRMMQMGFNPFSFNLDGLRSVYDLYYSFLFDYDRYVAIKSSLETSPSVVIVNSILFDSEIDFPKSVVLDMFLSFGVVGLAVLSGGIAWVLKKIQINILKCAPFSGAFIVSIYVLPLVMEFEKETFGIIISFMKWIPMLLLAYGLRPKIVVGQLPASVSDAQRAGPIPAR